jgi:hypothetical protein
VVPSRTTTTAATHAQKKKKEDSSSEEVARWVAGFEPTIFVLSRTTRQVLAMSVTAARNVLLFLAPKSHTSRRRGEGKRASGEHRLMLVQLHPSDHAVLVLQAKTIVK